MRWHWTVIAKVPGHPGCETDCYQRVPLFPLYLRPAAYGHA